MRIHENPSFGHLSQSRHLAVLTFVGVIAACVLGCGVGDYRQRVDARLNELAKTNDSAGLYASQPLGSKPVGVSIPQAFTRQPLVAGVVAAGEEGPPDDVRVKPGVIDMPGLTYTYEEFVADANGGQIPFYLHVSAEDKLQPTFKDPTAQWLKQVQQQFPGQAVAWENIECMSPTGTPNTWRRLRTEGSQSFFYKDRDGKTRTVKMPGVFEVYYRTEGDWAIALAWRVPASIASHVNLGKWAPMVAGAVSGPAGQAGVR